MRKNVSESVPRMNLSRFIVPKEDENMLTITPVGDPVASERIISIRFL